MDRAVWQGWFRSRAMEVAAMVSNRVVKVNYAGDVRRLQFGAVDSGSEMLATRALVQAGFDLPSGASMVFRYRDEEGDLCTLTQQTADDWVKQQPQGALRLELSVDELSGAAGSGRVCREHSTPGPEVACQQRQRPSEAAGARAARLAALARHSDEEIRRQAVTALCRLASSGCTEATACLFSLTSSEDEQVRRTCSTFLCNTPEGEVGGGSSTVQRDQKRQRCETRVTADVEAARVEALEGSETAVCFLRGVALEEVSREPLSSEQAALDRHSAVAALVAVWQAHPDVPAVTQALMSSTLSKDEHVRRTAARALVSGAASSDGTLMLLPPLATHDDEDIRRNVAQCLCRAFQESRLAEMELEPLTRHSDEHIRRLAASALCF